MDALSLVSDELSQEKVIVEDSSPEGASRIRLTFERGKLAKVEPRAAVIFMGGG